MKSATYPPSPSSVMLIEGYDLAKRLKIIKLVIWLSDTKPLLTRAVDATGDRPGIVNFEVVWSASKHRFRTPHSAWIVLGRPPRLDPLNEHCIVPNLSQRHLPLLRRYFADLPFLFSVPKPPHGDSLGVGIRVASAKQRKWFILRRNLLLANYLEDAALDRCCDRKECAKPDWPAD